MPALVPAPTRGSAPSQLRNWSKYVSSPADHSSMQAASMAALAQRTPAFAAALAAYLNKRRGRSLSA